MTRFSLDDDVAVVEHNPATRKPREGGKVHYATITGIAGLYCQVRYDDPGAFTGRRDTFWLESGWRTWDGMRRWRLVPVCHRCEKPITGIPVTAGDDPLGRQWCSGECLDAAAEASYEQQYRPGVAT